MEEVQEHPGRHLPPEIWYIVLEHLFCYANINWRGVTSKSISNDGRRDIEALGLTCSFLRCLAEPFLFSEFKHDRVCKPAKAETPDILWKAHQASSIERLQYFQSPEIAPNVRFVRFVYGFRGLSAQTAQQAYMEYCDLVTSCLRDLRAFENLFFLKLHNLKLSRGDMISLSMLERPIPELELEDCTNSSGYPFRTAKETIPAKCVTIKNFDEDRDQEPIIAMLDKSLLDSLTIKSLMESYVADALLSHCDAMAQLRTLRVVSDNEYNEKRLSKFPGLIPKLTSLETLEITCYDIDWSNFTSISLAPGALPRLKTLSCSIEAVEYFARQESLMEIVFKEPHVGDPESFAELLQCNMYKDLFSRLKRLTIRAEYLGMVYNEKFRAIQQTFSNLEVLNILSTTGDTMMNAYDKGDLDDAQVSYNDSQDCFS